MQLNLTSMIDVIFLLLIYFVISASFTIGEGVLIAKLPAGTGEASDTLEPPKQPLRIILSRATEIAGCRIHIEGAEHINNFTDLADMLVRLQYDPDRGRNGIFKPDNPVQIVPEGKVRWQHVVNSFNATLKARYTNVAFARAGES